MIIRMIKKATVILMATAMVLVMATGAFAVQYYEVANYISGPNNQSLQAFYSSPGVKAISFPSNSAALLTGPDGDALVNTRNYQTISGTYTMALQNPLVAGIYELTLLSGTSSVVKAIDATRFTGPDNDIPVTVFRGSALATLINFNDHTISWLNQNDNNSVTSVTINNSDLGSTTLANMSAEATKYSFTSFTFSYLGDELGGYTLATEQAWLNGLSGTKTSPYQSTLAGFAAVPEPAEWMLMFIGLGMLGYYLQRRGNLNFDLSPQSVA